MTSYTICDLNRSKLILKNCKFINGSVTNTLILLKFTIDQYGFYQIVKNFYNGRVIDFKDGEFIEGGEDTDIDFSIEGHIKTINIDMRDRIIKLNDWHIITWGSKYESLRNSIELIKIKDVDLLGKEGNFDCYSSGGFKNTIFKYKNYANEDIEKRGNLLLKLNKVKKSEWNEEQTMLLYNTCEFYFLLLKPQIDWAKNKLESLQIVEGEPIKVIDEKLYKNSVNFEKDLTDFVKKLKASNISFDNIKNLESKVLLAFLKMFDKIIINNIQNKLTNKELLRSDEFNLILQNKIPNVSLQELGEIYPGIYDKKKLFEKTLGEKVKDYDKYQGKINLNKQAEIQKFEQLSTYKWPNMTKISIWRNEQEDHRINDSIVYFMNNTFPDKVKRFHLNGGINQSDDIEEYMGGLIHIENKVSNVMLVYGFKIKPEYFEKILNSHSQCATVGFPDCYWDDEFNFQFDFDQQLQFSVKGLDLDGSVNLSVSKFSEIVTMLSMNESLKKSLRKIKVKTELKEEIERYEPDLFKGWTEFEKITDQDDWS